MYLEIIAQSLEDAQNAEEAGANRIELVQAMHEDGLSPTIERIEVICQQTKIPIRVMVRFHNRDFVYTEAERIQMAEWIMSVRHLPIEGFVLGGLTKEGAIDTTLLDHVAKVIGAKKMTFHRAFDRLTWEQQKQAIKILQRYPFIDTLLTSGGLEQPLIANLPRLVELTHLAKPLQILVGGGMNSHVFQRLSEFPELQAIHIGSAVREKYDFNQPISKTKIRKFKKGN